MHSNDQGAPAATITVPGDLDYSAAIRDFTVATMKSVAHMEETWAYRLQLAVDELFMNAVRYGSSPSSEVRVTFAISPEEVEVTVDDSGDGANPTSAEELARKIDEARREHEARAAAGEINLADSGRGLSQLVTLWTDELRFKPSPLGGIRVIIRKRIPVAAHGN